jgi:hypothetical protein
MTPTETSEFLPTHDFRSLLVTERIENQSVIFKLPTEVKSFLAEHAKATNTTLSSLIRSFIADGIDSINKQA